MKEDKPTKKVLIKIEQYGDDPKPTKTDILEFIGVNLEMLRTLNPDPTEALKIALKVAYQLSVFDPAAKGKYTILSQRMKGTIDVSQMKK
ncbi:hypothetical protein E2P63_03670 [Candidatus Bathyarchaeota archaeon]|nr:hypothetical protein E2P63_03670 [Candidatus Bathyarchaeota archaeon]